MKLRFRKRLKLLPGVHLNLSLRRGVSMSVGQPGLTHNIGLDGKRRTTVGLPGSGVTAQHQWPDTSAGSGSHIPTPHPPQDSGAHSVLAMAVAIAVIAAVFAAALLG